MLSYSFREYKICQQSFTIAPRDRKKIFLNQSSTTAIINSLNNRLVDAESRAANENLAISWHEMRRGHCYTTIRVTHNSHNDL